MPSSGPWLKLSTLLRIAALATVVAVPALVAHSAHHQYAQALADAQVSAANTVRVLEQHAARTLETVDTYLLAVASFEGTRSGAPRPQAMHAILRDQFARSRGLSNIVILDRNGRSIVEAAAYPARPLNVHDRDYFQTLRDRPDAGLTVGQPIIGSLTHTLVLPVARRINNPDGSFAGIVQAVIDPNAFQGIYDSIDNGPGAVLNLWRSDGTLLVRSPHRPEMVGRNYADTDNYRRYIAARDTKPFWAAGATDGVERVIAIGFLEDFPLYVGAALSRDHVLADWRRSTIIQAGVAGVLTLVLVGALFVLAREHERRREADARIRASEEHYRLLAQNTSDVITRLTLDFKRTYVSPSCLRLFGYTPEQMLGDQPSATIHPDDVMAVRGAARQLAAGYVIGDQATVAYRARHKIGRWIWIEATLNLARDVTGAPDSIVCVLRDAGGRKADEAQLVLAREAAEAARARAEEADQAKGEFLATMSHELRTPLNGVIGYADLLCEEPSLSPTARLHAERIRGAGSALLTVVNDVLDFSKIEAGQVEITPQPFALAALVEGAAAIVRSSAEAKGLGLNVHVAPGLPGWIEGDHDRLRQILLNLLSNAIKFTAQGWVCLKVEAAEEGDGRTRLCFSVSDTGIGVRADKRDRLFRRFSQVDGSISRDHGGTGLGLAISKALVGLMRGTIGCDSEPGRGSTFWFEVALPVAVPARTRPALSVVRTATMRVGRRLLLAEDVPLNQELARIILEQAGHAVDVVDDGAAAVAAVQAGNYDLVLMDIQMPVLDGVAAARLIRALDGPAGRVPILAMTANVLPDQVAGFLAAGMDGHIGKPFRPDALLNGIDHWTRSDSTTARSYRTVDRGVLENVRSMVGDERVRVLLGKLAEGLDQWFGPQAPTGDRLHLSQGAHAVMSGASLLGFTELSEACRAVEATCLSNDPDETALVTLRARIGEAIDEIERLKVAC